MTDLSIIIPTYNRLWALPKAVDSCFSEGCTVEVGGDRRRRHRRHLGMAAEPKRTL